MNLGRIARLHTLLSCTLAVVLCMLPKGIYGQVFQLPREPHGKSQPVSRSTAPSRPSAATRQPRRSVIEQVIDAEPLPAPKPINAAPQGRVPVDESLLQNQIVHEEYPVELIEDGSYACDQWNETGAIGRVPGTWLIDWSRGEFWVGAASFTSASNFLTPGDFPDGKIAGSFGFQEGFNFGSCVPGLMNGQVGAQLGVRGVHSQLEGSAAGPDGRNQIFATTGLFRRVDVGLQGGLVVDYLHDDGLFSADFVQLRGELSYMLSPCHDAGFRFSTAQQTANTAANVAGLGLIDLQLKALDTYRFFYRYRFGEQAGGTAEVHGGFSEDRDGLFGISLSTPLQGSVGLSTSLAYMFPHRGAQPTYTSESWNLGVAVVWTPGRLFGYDRDYYRPLFDVADNGSLFTKRQ